jgi:hypothetical protein
VCGEEADSLQCVVGHGPVLRLRDALVSQLAPELLQQFVCLQVDPQLHLSQQELGLRFTVDHPIPSHSIPSNPLGERQTGSQVEKAHVQFGQQGPLVVDSVAAERVKECKYFVLCGSGHRDQRRPARQILLFDGRGRKIQQLGYI